MQKRCRVTGREPTEKAMEFASRVYQEAAQANASTEATNEDEATEAEFVNK